jgi:surfactin synthase thioesterase subunit
MFDINDLVVDVLDLVQRAIKELGTPDRRFTLYGESMGGAIVLLAALKLQQETHPIHANFVGCHMTGATTRRNGCKYALLMQLKQLNAADV